MSQGSELTVRASAGILYDALGCSDATASIIGGAVEEVKAGDLSLEVGVDVCWARKYAAREDPKEEFMPRVK